MSVRNRIASFEAHNEERRKYSPTASPSVVSPHSVSPLPSSKYYNSFSRNSPLRTGSVSSPSVASSSQQYTFEGHQKPSPDRPASTTFKASQNRVHRLQRQAAESTVTAASSTVSSSALALLEKMNNNVDNDNTPTKPSTGETRISRLRRVSRYNSNSNTVDDKPSSVAAAHTAVAAAPTKALSIEETGMSAGLPSMSLFSHRRKPFTNPPPTSSAFSPNSQSMCSSNGSFSTCLDDDEVRQPLKNTIVGVSVVSKAGARDYSAEEAAFDEDENDGDYKDGHMNESSPNHSGGSDTLSARRISRLRQLKRIQKNRNLRQMILAASSSNSNSSSPNRYMETRMGNDEHITDMDRNTVSLTSPMTSPKTNNRSRRNGTFQGPRLTSKSQPYNDEKEESDSGLRDQLPFHHFDPLEKSTLTSVRQLLGKNNTGIREVASTDTTSNASTSLGHQRNHENNRLVGHYQEREFDDPASVAAAARRTAHASTWNEEKSDKLSFVSSPHPSTLSAVKKAKTPLASVAPKSPLSNASTVSSSNKDNITNNIRGLVMSPSSSSEYEVDGDRSRCDTAGDSIADDGGSASVNANTMNRRSVGESRGMVRRVGTVGSDSVRGKGDTNLYTQVLQDPSMSASQLSPDVAAFFDRRSKQKDDDDTYDYSGRDEGNNVYNQQDTFESIKDDDDDSQASISYAKRVEKRAKEEEARKTAAAAAKANMDSPFMHKEDVEHYRKTLDTPAVKLTAGVAAAATLGCCMLGPVGLLVGAAAVGIGVGVMQIPQEQRNNMQEKAAEALRGAQESALNATEALSNSCAYSYRESGIDDHVPLEMKTCCRAIDEEVNQKKTSRAHAENNGSKHRRELAQSNDNAGMKANEKSISSPTRFRNHKKDNIAVLREGQIIPARQIHSLDPAAQPRAWLDVLASAKTSHDEKMEAMEEILILAKDKQRARIFLEEGILDSIMWTLGRYFEKLEYNKGVDNWANPEITKEEANAARLTANCCLTLGKSHCAAIHTGGDLLLMSMYERGTVPEERQLAQMLHEVPYHLRITKTDDPTSIDPSKEVFGVTQLSLPQAEELAQKIKAIADGKAQ